MVDYLLLISYICAWQTLQIVGDNIYRGESVVCPWSRVSSINITKLFSSYIVKTHTCWIGLKPIWSFSVCPVLCVLKFFSLPATLMTYFLSLVGDLWGIFGLFMEKSTRPQHSPCLPHGCHIIPGQSFIKGYICSNQVCSTASAPMQVCFLFISIL